VLLEPDGSILVGGSGYGPATTADVPPGGFAVLRYHSDGTPDLSFGNAGKMLTTVADAGGIANALGLLPDGRIVAAGLATFKGTQPR
jgi:sugar lactone lactonase YvrE